MNIARPNRVTRSYTQRLIAAPAAVFPLLCPVREADWILVLDSGRLVEQGTHEELVARGGRYWELLRRQQLEEELEEASDKTA